MKLLQKKHFYTIAIVLFLPIFLINNNLHSQSNISATGWEKEIFGAFDANMEIIENRDLYTKHFRNSTGKTTAIIGAGPIHYEENGVFKTIFHTIHQNNNHFYNHTNSFKSNYPLTANQPIETFIGTNEAIKDLIDLKMYFIANNQANQPISAKAVKGNVNYNEIIYPNTFGEGIDLIIHQMTTKRKVDYKIHSLNALGNIPNGAKHLVFEEKVQLPSNWKLELKNNVILILNEKNEKVAQYDQPIFRSTEEHAHENDSRKNVETEISGIYRLSYSNNQYTIQTLVPIEWLTNQDLKFPVFIDPTVNCTPDNVANWTGYHRTYSSATSSNLAGSATYTSTNIDQSTNDELRVGRFDAQYVYNSWAKFNITAVPDDACINSIRVYYNVFSNSTTDSDCRVNCDVTHMHTDPVLHTSAVNRLADIRDGVVYQTRDFANHNSTGGWKNFLLSNNLNQFTAQLPVDWFAIGFHNFSGANGHTTCNNGIRGRSHADKPYLVVDYSTPATPTFTQVAAICTGGTFTLPTTSSNSITGTWSPAINNTATTTYTFTPAAGQCSSATTTMTVTVNNGTTPTFTQVAAICTGGTFTLPTTSSNSITGTWSPAINNTATTTYTFTPAAGQCATTATMTVAVNNATTPTFTQVAAICTGGTFTLPTTSTNSITGTWSPANNNTTTTTYTFTPTAGQCAATATMTVNVNSSTLPTFTQVAAICTGGTFTLPTTSTNNINGTWSPANNSSATTTYTFTPTAGQCATTATMTVTVAQSPTLTATKTDITCNGLTNGTATINVTNSTGPYTYTWTPAVSTTASATNLATGTYSVTATNSTGCTGSTSFTIAQPSALQVTITNISIGCTPNTSSATATVAGGTAPYSYAWSPTGGTAATSTQLSSGTFTATVTDANGCTKSENVTIGNAQPIQVSLVAKQPSCLNNDGELEAIIIGGTAPFTYTWTPNAANQTINTNLPAGTYDLTVQDANGCTGQASETLVIAGTIGVDITANPSTIVEGQEVNLFANVNGNYGAVTYTWTPSNQLSCANCPNPIVSTPTYGTLTYVVTVESPNGCVGKDTIQLIVLQKCGEVFIPTAFSPNGDGENDEFKALGNCIEKINLKIYNRWGEVVFESDDKNFGWDGTHKGKNQNSGTYTYIIDVTTRDHVLTTYKGSVALVK